MATGDVYLNPSIEARHHSGISKCPRREKSSARTRRSGPRRVVPGSHRRNQLHPGARRQLLFIGPMGSARPAS